MRLEAPATGAHEPVRQRCRVSSYRLSRMERWLRYRLEGRSRDLDGHCLGFNPGNHLKPAQVRFPPIPAIIEAPTWTGLPSYVRVHRCFFEWLQRCANALWSCRADIWRTHRFASLMRSSVRSSRSNRLLEALRERNGPHCTCGSFSFSAKGSAEGQLTAFRVTATTQIII